MSQDDWNAGFVVGVIAGNAPMPNRYEGGATLKRTFTPIIHVKFPPVPFKVNIPSFSKVITFPELPWVGYDPGIISNNPPHFGGTTQIDVTELQSDIKLVPVDSPPVEIETTHVSPLSGITLTII